MQSLVTYHNKQKPYETTSTFQKYEQGRSKLKTPHDERVITMFVRVDKPNKIISYDGSIYNSIDGFHSIYTTTQYSTLESIMLLIDNTLILGTDRYTEIIGYINALSEFIDKSNNLLLNKQKRKFMKAIDNDNSDIILPYIASLLNMNIFVYEYITKQFKLSPFTEYNDKNISIILLKRDTRMFPIIDNDGINMFSDKNMKFVKILQNMGILETSTSSSEIAVSSEDESN